MNDTNLKRELTNKLLTLWNEARDKYQIKRQPPALSFGVRGKTAGYAYPLEWAIKLNLDLARKSDAILNNTLPHELAHLIAWEVYRDTIKPHGKEWKAICKELGGSGERLHNIPFEYFKQFTRFLYRCGCQSYKLSAVRHNRIQSKKAVYRCKKCKVELTKCID